MSFSTEDLISAVLKRELLWDVTHKYFKDRKLTSEAWKEVCRELETNEDFLVKKRWKTLKDYYRSEVNKLDKPKSSTSGSLKKSSTWAYFHQLGFIQKTLGNNKHLCSLQSTENEDEGSVDGNIFVDEDDNGDEIKQQQVQHYAQNDISSANSEASFSERSPKIGEEKKQPHKRKHGSDFRKLFFETEGKKLAFLERDSEEVDDLMFLKSLLPDMKSLPRIEKLRLRMDMQKLVYDAIVRNTLLPSSSWDNMYASSSAVTSPVTTSSLHEGSSEFINLSHVAIKNEVENDINMHTNVLV